MIEQYTLLTDLSKHVSFSFAKFDPLSLTKSEIEIFYFFVKATYTMIID